MPDQPENPPAEAPKKKKKDKVQAAWISFVGRIVAQILGAAATVVLGVFVLQKYQSSSDRHDGNASCRSPCCVGWT